MNKGEHYRNIGKVLDRAEKLDIGYADRLSGFMDLDYSKVNVDKLLTFDDFNFTHDVCGIRQNFNRKTKKLDNCFLPRAGCLTDNA